MEADRERLLIVEDVAAERAMFARALAAPDREIQSAGTGADARRSMAAHPPDVVLLDLRLPDMPGIDLLGEAAAMSPAPLVVILTGHADEPTVVKAMGLGAVEFVSKPPDLDDLGRVVAGAFHRVRLMRSAPEPRPSAARAVPEGFMVGTSAPMIEVFRMIGVLAPSDVPVLVTGETGTGKELAARALHAYGPRAGGPFVAVDCASLSATLLESELFGHERGAFTGAVSAKPGKFELADGGTLFLDEIGNIPMDIQAKLLRALQERATQRVGSNQTVKWHARVVAATHVDLKRAVAGGTFREDLMFRIAGAEVRMPALRERTGDLPRLVDHFMGRAAAGRTARHVSAEALALLGAYAWPGNVRELEHVIGRAVALARTPVIGAADLPPDLRSALPVAGAPLLTIPDRAGLVTMDAMRRRYARHALNLCEGNRSEAARLLDLDRGTLAELLKED